MMIRPVIQFVGKRKSSDPKVIRELMSDADYKLVREILRGFSADRIFFSYCTEDDTLIWHSGTARPWKRDDDGSQFLTFAAGKSNIRLAALALNYFKKYCSGSHINGTIKAARLARQDRLIEK